MNQLMAALMLLSISFVSHADITNLTTTQVYQGTENYNEKPTGNICQIMIAQMNPIPEKGLHCTQVGFVFQTPRTDIPKEMLLVDSRITNRHRPEFPQIKTCAMNVNGTLYGDEIYGADTTQLFIHIFGGMQKDSANQYDYFLSLNPKTKLAIRSRIHVSNSQKEYDVDCVDLQLLSR